MSQELCRRRSSTLSVIDKVNSGMKHVSFSCTSIQYWVYINLVVLILASSRRLRCHGLLQDCHTEKHRFGAHSLSRDHKFPIRCSSTFDHTKNSKSVLEKAGGISYRQSVCTPQEINSIQNEISLVMKRHLTKERSSIAQNRLGATLIRDQTSETIRILEEGSIFKLAQRLANSSHNDGSDRRIELAPEIPVEVRLYEQVGAAMSWHRDDIMYDPPQLELVFTLENNSDCVTMWKMQGNNVNNNTYKNNGEIHSQETHPNSLLLLLAGGPNHCVTSLKRGRRVILKCAYIYTGATYVGEEDYHQFGKAKGQRASKAKKRKRNAKR